MFLKTAINYSDFLTKVRLCDGSVMFCSREGDVLDLKSELCRYVFAVTGSRNHEFIFNGTVECKNPNDLVLLDAYLEQREPVSEGA